MPNGKAHAMVGSLSGGAGALCLASADANGCPVVETVGGLIGGYVGGKLPDWLEPSLGNPRHRSHCHSWAALGIDGGAAAKWLVALQTDLRNRALRHKADSAGADSAWERVWHLVLQLLLLLAAGAVAGLAAGVASHLALDAGTKAGLQIA